MNKEIIYPGDEDNKATGDHFKSLTLKAKVRYQNAFQYDKNRDMGIFQAQFM